MNIIFAILLMRYSSDRSPLFRASALHFIFVILIAGTMHPNNAKMCRNFIFRDEGQFQIYRKLNLQLNSS